MEPVKQRFQMWLVRWLGIVSTFEFYSARAADKQQFRDEYRSAIADMKAEHDAQIAELVQELNALRNSKQPVTEQKKPVRVIPSWGTFRTAVESQPKPIKIERTS